MNLDFIFIAISLCSLSFWDWFLSEISIKVINWFLTRARSETILICPWTLIIGNSSFSSDSLNSLILLLKPPSTEASSIADIASINLTVSFNLSRECLSLIIKSSTFLELIKLNCSSLISLVTSWLSNSATFEAASINSYIGLVLICDLIFNTSPK